MLNLGPVGEVGCVPEGEWGVDDDRDLLIAITAEVTPLSPTSPLPRTAVTFTASVITLGEGGDIAVKDCARCDFVFLSPCVDLNEGDLGSPRGLSGGSLKPIIDADFCLSSVVGDCEITGMLAVLSFACLNEEPI